MLLSLALLGQHCSRERQEVPLAQVERSPCCQPLAEGPRWLFPLGDYTPIRAESRDTARVVGHLRVGSPVPRAEQPSTRTGCAGGWYEIDPRGFVCVDDQSATLDKAHPDLRRLPLPFRGKQPLPYTYARVVRDTPLYELVSDQPPVVRRVGMLPSWSGLAVVGSWGAKSRGGQLKEFAQMTDGHLVAAGDLETAKASEFEGLWLRGDVQLPVAFVLKSAVTSWSLNRGKPPTPIGELPFHTRLNLEHDSRSVAGRRYHRHGPNEWVRAEDVTIVRPPQSLPSFVAERTRWIDVSIARGTLTLFEGSKAVFTTLVSSGADRELQGAFVRVTRKGDFRILAKDATGVGLVPSRLANRVSIYDVPWVMRLDSGQVIHGTYWHDRFGLEHGPGNLQLSPADARTVFHWVTPNLPPRWHTSAMASGPLATRVRIR